MKLPMAERGPRTTTSRKSKNAHPPSPAPVPAPETPPAEAPAQEHIDEHLDLRALHQMTMKDLLPISHSYEVEGASHMVRQDLIFAILQARAKKIGLIFAEGV